MSEEEDFSKLPVDARWRHAKWKARQSAYDDLIAGIQRGTPAFEPSLDDLKACASDANVIALESGIKAVIAIVQNLPENASNAVAIRQAVAKPLSEKGLVAAKPAVKQASMDALLMLVEVSDPAGLVEDLLAVLQSAKSPKAVAAVAQSLDRVFTEFGSPVAPVQPVLKALPPLFGHPDRNVRQAATGLAAALCRWVGEPVMLQVLAGIKPVQLNEVKAAFAKIDRGAQPTRFTREQQLKLQASGANGADGDFGDGRANGDDAARVGVQNGAAEAGDAIDPWDLAEPVDVLSKIPSDFWDSLGSVKWKERHEALSTVVPNLQNAVRMLPSGDYSRLANELLRIASKDMNQMCATQAIQGLGALALGLRQQYQPHAQRTLEAAVERFKEKKQAVIDVVCNCMDAVYFRVLQSQFAPIVETVVEVGMKHKTPQVRIEVSKYIAHLLRETTVRPKPAEIQPVSSIAVKLLGDSSEPMRAAAANVLAALVKIAGAAKMASVLEPLDEHKKKRVNEAVANTTVKVKSPTAGAGAQPQAQGQPPRKAPGARPGAVSSTASGARPARQGGMAATSTAASAGPTSGVGSGLSGAASARADGRQPPSHLAPRVPASTRRPLNSSTSPLSRRPAGLSVQGPDISMGLTSPSPAEPRSGRPSLSSTPKMVKRTSTNAEFTPARGVDTYRRRIYSPAKPEFDDGLSLEGAGAGKGDDDDLEPNIGELARLSAELELEKSLRLEAEKKLALVQVEKDREILRLQEEASMLKLQLKNQKQEFEIWLKGNERRWSQPTLSSDDMGNRLSVLSLEADSRPASRAPGAPPSRRPPSRVLPIGVSSTSSTAPATTSTARSGNDEWERAVSMTHSLKKRVEQLRQQKQKGA